MGEEGTYTLLHELTLTPRNSKTRPFVSTKCLPDILTSAAVKLLSYLPVSKVDSGILTQSLSSMLCWYLCVYKYDVGGRKSIIPS